MLVLTKKIKDRNCKVNACSGVREVPLHGMVRKGLELFQNSCKSKASRKSQV